MTVKLGGKLPKNEDQNGLDERFRQFMHDPGKPQVVIAIVQTSKITRDLENYDAVPTVTVRAIEAIDGDDAGRLRSMLQRRHEERTGNLELPAAWEEVLADMASPTLPHTEPGR